MCVCVRVCVYETFNIHPERTVVLIYDGNTSHISVRLTEEARKENVILKLLPHASHVLYLMNLTVYWPLELKWDEAITKWQRRNYPLAQEFQFGVII